MYEGMKIKRNNYIVVPALTQEKKKQFKLRNLPIFNIYKELLASLKSYDLIIIYPDK